MKTHLDLFHSAVSDRMRLLPLVAGLSATLLVVATFNEKLVPLDNIIRLVISVLLLLIPFSLYFYNEDLKTTQRNTKAEIDNLSAKKSDPEADGIKGNIAKWLPDIAIYLLGILVIVLIVKIWHPL